MCGRFAFFSPAEAITAAFGPVSGFEYTPRYNIAPSQDVLALVDDAAGGLRAERYRWGLVPFWAKDPAIGQRMINARAETIAEKPSYRQSFRRRRCLIMADGFYEWHDAGKGKQPYFICREDERPFGLAAIWDEWRSADALAGEPALRSCSIITVPANPFMSDLHHRMPVLMSAGDLTDWFNRDGGNDELLGMLLRPQEVALQAWPVDRRVNNPVNDAADLIAPAD